MQQNGMKAVRALFSHRAGGTFELTLTPLAHPPFGDLFTYFIIPYVVGLAFLGHRSLDLHAAPRPACQPRIAGFHIRLEHDDLRLSGYGHHPVWGPALGFEPGRDGCRPGASRAGISSTLELGFTLAAPAFYLLGYLSSACRSNYIGHRSPLPILFLYQYLAVGLFVYYRWPWRFSWGY